MNRKFAICKKMKTGSMKKLAESLSHLLSSRRVLLLWWHFWCFSFFFFTSVSGRASDHNAARLILEVTTKEYVERRHGELNKFLFLPKMDLLGSQAGNEKKTILNYELLLRAVFSCFHKQFFYFLFFLHCRVRIKKLH